MNKNDIKNIWANIRQINDDFIQSKENFQLIPYNLVEDYNLTEDNFDQHLSVLDYNYKPFIRKLKDGELEFSSHISSIEYYIDNINDKKCRFTAQQSVFNAPFDAYWLMFEHSDGLDIISEEIQNTYDAIQRGVNFINNTFEPLNAFNLNLGDKPIPYNTNDKEHYSLVKNLKYAYRHNNDNLTPEELNLLNNLSPQVIKINFNQDLYLDTKKIENDILKFLELNFNNAIDLSSPFKNTSNLRELYLQLMVNETEKNPTIKIKI